MYGTCCDRVESIIVVAVHNEQGEERKKVSGNDRRFVVMDSKALKKEGKILQMEMDTKSLEKWGEKSVLFSYTQTLHSTKLLMAACQTAVL